jgi:preprotein translocase subunit SecD
VVVSVVVYYAALRGDEMRPGVKVVYKAAIESGTPSHEHMEKTVDILDRRLKELGVAKAQIQLAGPDRISIVLPDDVKDVDQTLAIAAKTAQLKFYDDGVTRVSGPASSLDEAFARAKKDPQVLLTEAERKDLVAMQKTAKERRASGGAEPVADSAVADGLASDSLVVVTAEPGKAAGNTDTVYFIYRDEPAMMGDAVKAARQAFAPYSQSPDVEMDFTDEGGKQFQEVTRRLWDRGSFFGVPQQFAIVLDGKMESDPQIDYSDPNMSGGIQGGKAIITGDFSQKEAKDLALVLNTGALPVTLELVQQQSL